MRTIYLGAPQLDLWTICDPDAPVPSGEHTHRCGSCGTTWRHGDSVNRMSTVDFNMAHSCPNCGREETYKYRSHGGDEACALIDAPTAFLALKGKSI